MISALDHVNRQFRSTVVLPVLPSVPDNALETRTWLAYWREYTREMTITELRALYTHGCCGVLAHVLARRLGWPVWGVFSSQPCWRRPLLPHLMHVLVQNPQTTLFSDGNGAEQCEDEVLDFYHAWHPRHRLFPIEGDDYFRHPLEPGELDRDGRYWVCEREHLPHLLPELMPAYTAAHGQPRLYQGCGYAIHRD